MCESGTNSYEVDPIETHICETEYSQKFFFNKPALSGVSYYFYFI